MKLHSTVLMVLQQSEERQEKINGHLFGISSLWTCKNATPRFPLQSRIHLKQPQISTTLEASDPKKNIVLQAEMPDMLRKRFPKFFGLKPLLASKVTTDPHTLVHANTECPDDRYPK